MPPIKTRTCGREALPSEGDKPESSSSSPQKRSKIPLKPRGKFLVRPSPLRNSPMMEHVGKEENLKKLRVPSKLLHSLPSVKKYQDSQDFVDLTEIGSDYGDSNASHSDFGDDVGFPHVTTSKRARSSVGNKVKFRVTEVAEERFLGIVWDVSMSPVTREVLVACCDGLYLCHEDLSQKKKLTEVILPGGVEFLLDGSIVALCRNTDTVHLFSAEGTHVRSFLCGKAPMTLSVFGLDTIMVSDPTEKCIHFYNLASGNSTNTIRWESKGSGFKWPLYLDTNKETNVLVVDVHAQRIMEFTSQGRHVKDFRLAIPNGNEVLRPHGMDVHPKTDDIFVVDTALQTVEVFSQNDQYIQTVVSMEEGQLLKPKCLHISHDGQYVVVGGRSGKVRVYQFWDDSSTLNNDQKPGKLDIKIEPKLIKEEKLDPNEVIVLD